MNSTKKYFSELLTVIPFWKILFTLFSIEIISFAAFNFEIINTVAFFIITILTILISLKNLQYGVFIVFTELIIGSKGYLFSFDIGDFTLSIRLALFLGVFLAYIICILREKKIYFLEWSLSKPIIAIICVIFFGGVVGYLRGNELINIFLDGNGYLYIGLIGPFVQTIRTRKDFKRVISILLVGSIAVILKTVLLLFLFSQLELLPYTLPGIYRWIRESGVGEITQLDSGFSRIFFQSHIYMLILFFFIGGWFSLSSLKERKILTERSIIFPYSVFAACLLVIFLSYSRSFWVGTVVTATMLLTWLVMKERVGLRRIIALTALLIVTFALDYAVAFGIVNIPLPGNLGIGAGSLLTERTKNITEEPAAASRWSLLEPLYTASKAHLLIGSGLGTTVTYHSEDPRVLESNPNGLYTTYAFEWGYLDLLLKFGLVGVGVFLWFIIVLFRNGLQMMKKSVEEHREALGILSSIVSLLAVHMFTPYLNHPLGIGWLLFAAIGLSLHMTKREIDVYASSSTLT